MNLGRVYQCYKSKLYYEKRNFEAQFCSQTNEKYTRINQRRRKTK